MRLLLYALLQWQTSAVLEVARPRQTQPKAIRIAPPDRPTTDSRGGAVAAWFDVLCLAANYHCEHHDFPKVPLWNLPELKRLAGADFFPASPSWRAVLRGAFSSKITYPRWERV